MGTFTSSPVAGRMNAAIAETWKAIEPKRLSATMRHDVSRGSQCHQPWHTSSHASVLAIMKAIEPNMSGAHTRRSCWEVDSAASIALNVVRLNSSVPIDCTEADHQSMRCGCQANSRVRWRPSPASSVVLIVCTNAR